MQEGDESEQDEGEQPDEMFAMQQQLVRFYSMCQQVLTYIAFTGVGR